MTLIATPLAGPGETRLVETGVEDRIMDIPEEPLERQASRSQSPAATHVEEAQIPSTPISLGRRESWDRESPASADASSRIEDSVEALDKLEDEFEEIEAATRLVRVRSPERRPDRTTSRTSSPRQSPAAHQTSPVPRRPARATSTTGKQSTLARQVSTRKSTASLRRSLAEETTKEPEAVEEKVLVRSASRRAATLRPSSLAPPKAPVRSAKPATIASFELPGEAVSRRLKERREARLAQQNSPDKSPAVNASPLRARSLKQPTRPSFELPGEAISRRKREEREARLKAQEEEERKRREFKARPIRAGLVSSSFPRDTAASRARQNKVATDKTADKRTEVTLARTGIDSGAKPACSYHPTDKFFATGARSRRCC